MEKLISFGKIDYNNSGRKKCLVEVKIKYNNGNFSVSGVIWNPRKTDYYAGGQCLDTILEYVKAPMFIKIHKLWERWHLNDLKAGCEHQRIMKWGNDKINVACPACGYKYGTQWLKEEIPDSVHKEICKIMNERYINV